MTTNLTRIRRPLLAAAALAFAGLNGLASAENPVSDAAGQAAAGVDASANPAAATANPTNVQTQVGAAASAQPSANAGVGASATAPGASINAGANGTAATAPQAQQPNPSAQPQNPQPQAGLITGANAQGQLNSTIQNSNQPNAQAMLQADQNTNLGLQFGQPTAQGLSVGAVNRNSLFFGSGLQPGDVFVSFDGQPIRGQADFARWRAFRPGQRIPVVIWRNGAQQTIYVTQRANAFSQPGVWTQSQPTVAASAPSQAYLGVTLQQAMGAGAIVKEVNPGSPAQQAGLQAGDQITALNGQPVASGMDVVRIVGGMQAGQQVTIDFTRQSMTNQALATLATRPADRYTVGYAPQPAPAAAPIAPLPAQPLPATIPEPQYRTARGELGDDNVSGGPVERAVERADNPPRLLGDGEGSTWRAERRDQLDREILPRRRD